MLTAFHLRHVVVLIDGHGSNIKYHLSQFCAENEIVLFRLPPHTTSHAIQPTDRSYFATFKANFSKEVGTFTLEHPGMAITKWTFPTIFTKSYEISCSVEVVKSSFRTTGIWPVNRLKVYHNLFNPSKSYIEAAENVDFTAEQVVSHEASGASASVAAANASVGTSVSVGAMLSLTACAFQ